MTKFNDKWEVYNNGDPIPEGYVTTVMHPTMGLRSADMHWQAGVSFRRKIKPKRVNVMVIEGPTAGYENATCERNPDGSLDLTTIKGVSND